MLDLFINDGIRAYSNHLPRRLRHSLALTTGTQAYDLPGGHGFVRLLAVEYPSGESPPIYLEQVEEWDRSSWAAGMCMLCARLLMIWRRMKTR